MPKVLQEIEKMSVSERILLVEAIWDCISHENESTKLSAENEIVLENRLKSFRENPNEVHSWQQIKQSLK